ncbi:hypothetical protein FRC11_006344 [Ceratobasidium sp. 423]|nr:hypothetical protein FRC11_006344 [Ceratobasidium sp. 423]
MLRVCEPEGGHGNDSDEYGPKMMWRTGMAGKESPAGGQENVSAGSARMAWRHVWKARGPRTMMRGTTKTTHADKPTQGPAEGGERDPELWMSTACSTARPETGGRTLFAHRVEGMGSTGGAATVRTGSVGYYSRYASCIRLGV